MEKTRRKAVIRVATSLALVATAVMVPALPAEAAPSGATYVQVEPKNPSNSNELWIERIAPTSSSTSPTWRVNVDMYVKAPAAHSVTLTTVTTSFPGSSLSSSTKSVNKFIGSDDYYFLVIPESRRFAFPIATNIRFQLNFSGYDSIVINRTLKEYVNKTPSGGYRFPAKAVSGGYWYNLIGHENGGGDHNDHHRGVQNQRFAYDLVIEKWNPLTNKWSDLKPGETGNQNTDFWTFGTPIYAMADGVITKCRKDQVDNTPDIPDPTPEVEGNHLYIRHATGEVALYAHFKTNGIASGLCPSAAATNLNIAVKQGQLLGYSGNTGNSYGPHLHLHLANMTGFDDGVNYAQGLPLRFNHATTRTATNYTPGASPGFASLTNSSEGALPDWNLIQPNSCGFNRVVGGGSEFARHGVKLGCFQEEFNDISLAGYRMIWRQQVDYSSDAYVSSIWRSNSSHLAWVSRSGLTAAEFQSAFNTYTNAGYRVTHVDSYIQSGAVRYSVLFHKSTGVAQLVYHGASAATHQSRFNSYTANGYFPREISVVSVGGSRYYTARYEHVSVGGFVATSVLESSYQSYVNTQVAAGRKLTYIDVYRDGTVNRFSVIFAQNVGSNWAAIHDATTSQYQTAYTSNTNAGRLTRAVSAYVSNGLKYAGLWRA